MNAALLLALAAVSGSLSLYAQSASTPAATVHHHHVAARTSAAAPDAPKLPPGVPAVVGKLETAFALRYIDARLGEGALVSPGDFITVHYTGWLASDGTKFDSSYDRNAPFTFPQGMHRVIAGWDEGFAGMRVGGKRRLFIPYQMAYGESGRLPVIPAKSDLIFDIELVSASATSPEPSAPLAPAPQ